MINYIPAPPKGEGGILFYLCPSKIFFSATIDGRNLIFGHKLHMGMPYCGKRFWTCQIPTSWNRPNEPGNLGLVQVTQRD